MIPGAEHRNGTGGSAPSASVRAAVPVALVRYRDDLTDRSAGDDSAVGRARVVHLVPVTGGGRPGAVSALCGRLLRPEEIEHVTPGDGAPCTGCLVSHVATRPAPDSQAPDDTQPSTPAGSGELDELPRNAAPAAAASCFQNWGWTVAVRRQQVWLRLGGTVVALLIPIPLATRIVALLTERRCPPAVLANPYAPDHQLLLAGEPYPATLPWPTGVHRVNGSTLLPPTNTPRGPLTWAHPPGPDSLRLCREIDVLAALRAAGQEPPADDPPPQDPIAF